MSDRPLCFVLMPFGVKKDPAGGPDVDFNRIYHEGIRPAIEDAGMEPIRADEERTTGIIHKAMFERLLLCDFAVADLTTANANVFYELGVRHAARPATTLAIFAKGQTPPFDVNYLRALPYELAEGNALGVDEAKKLREGLAKRLREVREIANTDAAKDSPIFQLLDGYAAPPLDHLKTDTFRDQARYSEELRKELAAARETEGKDAAVAALAAIEAKLGRLDAVEVGVLVDLFLSYRAVEAWDRMIALYERLPREVKRTVMLREQLGFALNRAGRKDEAVKELEGVIAEKGPSAETCGILGRVYKDRWNAARKDGKKLEAAGHLKRAIETYLRGFEADWRDAYPGINAATLLDIKGDDASLERKAQILPLVRYASKQRLKGGTPGYWDHATLLEIAVLENDEEAAAEHLGDALAAKIEGWEPKSTADNLEMIRTARRERGVEEAWFDELIGALRNGGA
jgi:tetratricopeptide (TPR) repeat protein